MLHLLEARHSVRENKIRVTELPWDTAVLGIQRVEASLMGVGAAACSKQTSCSLFLKAPVAFTPWVALTKLFPSHLSASGRTG